MPSNSDSGTTTPGVLATIETLSTISSAGNYLVKVNPVNLVADETVLIEIFDKVLTGDTTNNNLVYTGSARADQTEIMVSIPISVVFEATVRITQFNGTLRAFDWAVVDMS